MAVGEVSGSERMLAAMVDPHGDFPRSCVIAAVAVEPAVALASRTYGKDRPKERKVGGVVEMAGHG